jgi:hypothetical protein
MEEWNIGDLACRMIRSHESKSDLQFLAEAFCCVFCESIWTQEALGATLHFILIPLCRVARLGIFRVKGPHESHEMWQAGIWRQVVDEGP